MDTLLTEIRKIVKKYEITHIYTTSEAHQPTTILHAQTKIRQQQPHEQLAMALIESRTTIDIGQRAHVGPEFES